MSADLIGDYSVLRELSDGPFGSAYAVEHRYLKRTFALKLLPPEVTRDAAFWRRFEEEVERLASFQHPHLVPLYSASRLEGKAFLISDLIADSEGTTLHFDRFLEQRGELSEEEAVGLLTQVCEGLDALHDHNIVHGALKPSNILLRASDAGPQVLLADAGLTRMVGEGYALLAMLKRIAEGKGLRSQAVRSLAFLAPEQKRSDAAAITPAVDAWALGILAYTLLARKLPEGAYEAPSLLVPHWQGNWDLLIHKLLSPQAGMRPTRLVQALQEILASPKAISLAEVEPKLENIMQMSFEFQQREAALAAAPKPVLNPQQIARPEYEPDPGAIFTRDKMVSHYEPKKMETAEVEPLLTDMVVIVGGAYLRGSNEGARDEMPRHQVTLSTFALDIHPTTNEQFVRFLQAMGGEKDHNNNDIIRLRDSRVKRSGGKYIIESGYARHPVVGVTWYGAIAYAKWVGKRLPTEAEWEAAAACGKDVNLFPTGHEIERSQANYFSSDTTPVMSYPPNELGLYDLSGNVYEWCHDWYAYNYYDASALEPLDPQGPAQGVYRVLRGGCWKSLKEDLRCSHRHRNNPGAVNGTYGFRCAADVS